MSRRKCFTNWFFGSTRRRKQIAKAEAAEMQSLETRLLMSATNEIAGAVDAQQAPFAFSVKFTDLNGTPVSKVDVGDQFLITVSGTDQRPEPLGNFSAYTDVAYPTELIDIVDGDSAITQLRTDRVRGIVDDAAGLIDDAGNLKFRSSGPANEDLFSVLATATAPGLADVGTNSAESPFAQLALFQPSGQGSDERHEADYLGATLQIGELTPEVSLSSVPDIDDATANGNVVLHYSGFDITTDDFSGSRLEAVRGGDGAQLPLSFDSVETVREGREYRVTYTLDEPATGWNFAFNGTYDIHNVSLPGDIDVNTALGSFDIALTAPEFLTHVEITDAEGAPLDEIPIGTEFRVSIYGQDSRDLGVGNDQYLGLLSAMYDVDYSTEQIDVTDVIHHYSYPFEGTANDKSGDVDGVGGFYSSSATPGSGDRVKIVELVAVANAIGDVEITASPGESDFAQFIVQVPGQRTPLNVASQVVSGSVSATVIAPLEVSVSEARWPRTEKRRP